MKVCVRLLFAAVLLTMVFRSISLAETDLFTERTEGDAYVTQGDFQIALKVLDEKGLTEINMVDSACTFEISFASGDAQPPPYVICYFLDGHRDETIRGAYLPFTMKRDFRGIEEGEHTIHFEVIDSDGKAGVASKTITVNH